MTTWIYLFVIVAAIYIVKTLRKRREISIENAERFIKKGQYDQAESILLQLVGGGTTAAMLMLANMYIKLERGVDAAMFLAKSAENGYNPAGQILAELYWKGNGVERDPVKAKEILLPQAENGDVHSQYLLGHYHNEDNETGKARKWLELAAKNGSREAFKELAAMNP